MRNAAMHQLSRYDWSRNERSTLYSSPEGTRPCRAFIYDRLNGGTDGNSRPGHTMKGRVSISHAMSSPINPAASLVRAHLSYSCTLPTGSPYDMSMEIDISAWLNSPHRPQPYGPVGNRIPLVRHGLPPWCESLLPLFSYITPRYSGRPYR
jgi:hypothetical protein